MSKIDEIEKRINAGEDIMIEPDGTVRTMTPEEIVAREEDEKAAQEKTASRARKPILCLDFDGVINSYASGWKGADTIPDPPVPGALEFIASAMEHFTVAIFSSRSNQPGGIKAMQEWLDYWALMAGLPPTPVGEIIQWPTEKPAAFLTIDDRALAFTGEWPDAKSLLDFKPWNKR